jgi:DnaJ-class molecular chaperone
VKDYYKILEVSPEASLEEIKQQWRFLVQVWHPDRFANLDHKRLADEKFKAIHEAYAALSHPDYRQAYNAQRAAEERQRQAQAERAAEARRREELRQQEEAARHRATQEQQQREPVKAPGRHRQDERHRTAQIHAQSNLIFAWAIFWIFILGCFWLLVWTYQWFASYF